MGGKVAAIAALTLSLAAAPALADGQLAIQSRPAGATVTLDGSYAGPTPVLLDAPAGRYRIRVSMPGRAPQTFTATVRDGLTTRRVVTMAPPRPATGELVVRTRPAGAAIVLDGRVVGASPLHLGGLAPGRHRLRAVLDGHLAVARTVAVHPGLTASVSVGLVAMAPPAPAPVAERPAPKPTKRPVARPATAEAPAPKPVAPKPVAPIVTAMATTPRHVTPAAAAPPATPATPEALEVAPPPAAPSAPFELPDPRPWLFGGLMALLFAWGVKHLQPRWKRRATEAPAWHPARGSVGIAAWPGEGAPGEAAFAAVAAMGRGHWQLGLDALWRAIDDEPGAAWHYHHIGLALEQLGRPDEAEGAYRTAAQLAPAWAPPAYNMGALLARTGQSAQAVIAYRRLLEAVPGHADGLFNLGHAYVALGNPAQALVHWKALKKAQPRDAQVRANLQQLGRTAPRRPRRVLERLRQRRAS